MKEEHTLNIQKNKKILLVDDSKFIINIIGNFLNENGYVTESVTTGEDAVQKACEDFPPDLILMDIELEGDMDGIEAARRIFKYREIPIVFLTSNTTDKIINKIKDVDAYGFVLKGMDKAALLATVEMALKLYKANTNARMFDQVFENFANELFIFHPKSLKYVAVNASARNSLGYSAEEFKSMTHMDISPEFDMESALKLFSPLINSKQEQVFFNTVHRRKDGYLYPVEINLQNFNYWGEKLYLALAIDLTERRIIKEALNEKESILNTVVKSARDAIIMLDSVGNVTLWNAAAVQLFGYSEEEIIGKDLNKLILPENIDYNDFKKGFMHYKSTGEGKLVGKTIEVKARHKDGHELDVEISLSSLKIKDSLYTVGIVSDIGERKRSHEELENSHKQYLELSENAPIGILKCDIRGNIVYANQKTLEIVGSPSIEETKKINLLTFPLLVKSGLAETLEECLKTNKTGVYEMDYETKWRKKIWLRLHIKTLTNKNIVIGAQIIIDDITEKKQMEDELRNLSAIDYLTNIYNRRFFMQKLETEIERAQRTGSKFSLVMLDIDHFKKINDNFGHNAGDLVLKSIAEMIKSRIRKIDCLARWGGEEFVILLLDTTVNMSSALIEELRENISKINIPGVNSVTASFGVVTYSKDDTVDTLVQKADTMMYEAKTAGRNCVRYMVE